eukprot:COSAG02_NODE_8863_length_2417_cov_34.257981_2_plen_330_part_00
MSRLEEIDVSHLSVAECLALAEKQDTDAEDAAVTDPVEGILERLAKSATGVTQVVGEYSLDVGLAQNDEGAPPLQELSRHLSTVSLLSYSAVKNDLLIGLNVGLADMDEETRTSWASFFDGVVSSATPDVVTQQQVSVAALDMQNAIEGYTAALAEEALTKAQEHEDLITECSREYASLEKTTPHTQPRKVITKQFDEEGELNRLVETYQEIEKMLQTLEECVEIQKALSQQQTTGEHRQRYQQLLKKASEEHLGSAGGGVDSSSTGDDIDREKLLEKNAAVEKQVKIALARTVAEHCSSMNTEHVVSPKDSSLKKGDFELIDLGSNYY